MRDGIFSDVRDVDYLIIKNPFECDYAQSKLDLAAASKNSI